MTVSSGASIGGAVWQTRLSREAAATYEKDLAILGLDRSEALRRGLRLLHREALETRMAQDVDDYYDGERAPLSEVTAAAYNRDPRPESEERGTTRSAVWSRAATSGTAAAVRQT